MPIDPNIMTGGNQKGMGLPDEAGHCRSDVDLSSIALETHVCRMRKKLFEHTGSDVMNTVQPTTLVGCILFTGRMIRGMITLFSYEGGL